MKKMLIAWLVCAGAWSAVAGEIPALLGAKALIEKAQADAGKKMEAESTPGAKARTELRRDLAVFQQSVTNLAPREAAGRWLALLDRFWSLPLDADASSSGGYDYWPGGDMGEDEGEPTGAAAARPVSVEEVLKVMPGPASWKDLRALAEERKVEGDRTLRELGLKVLVRFLDSDSGKVDESIRQLEKALRASSGRSFHFGGYGGPDELRRAWSLTRGFESPADVVRQFRDALEKTRDDRQDTQSIVVPPLADLTTAAETDELLRKCLLTPGLRIEVRHQGATMDRLKALAMENMGSLPAPRWELVLSSRDMALFEAMERRFPKRKDEAKADSENTFVRQSYGDDGRLRAERIYIMALLQAGRVEDAFARYRQGPGTEEYGGNVWENLGYGEIETFAPTESQAAGIFKTMAPYAGKAPDRFPWAFWLNLGMMTGQGAEVVATLEAASTNSILNSRARLAVLGALANACLATDRVEEALVALRKINALDVSKLPADEQRELLTRQQYTVVSLLRLGRLLNRPDLMEEGLRVSAAAGGSGGAYEPMDTTLGASRYPTVLGMLVEAGRYAEAERRLLDALTRIFKKSANPGWRDEVRGQTGQIMGVLLTVYEKAGRYDDALWLLEESPWWSTPEFGADAYGESAAVPAAARVLVKAGRLAEAEGMIKEYLRCNPADDRGYEVLVSLTNTSHLAWLDARAASDRFEERPLIWKAVLLRNAGRLEEAEAVCRQALKVDPTDGEQEAGQRVKAYAVLADILEDRKKADDAKFFRNVVQAVRVAEEGDELVDAGLTSRSLRKFEEAERLFVDAYCVQWRLAERLWALGRFDEANRHYAIAFERMPEQFGQVASFCFGCQGVFQKEQSRTAAEEVLTRLARTQGQRPQVHFLLGQLREAQHRYADAFKSFRQAVELDAEYLDAWQKLYGLNEELYLPKKERDEIVFRGMELDPSRRHFGGGCEAVMDVGRMWSLAERGVALQMPRGKSFELRGTARAIAEETASLNADQAMMMQYALRRYSGRGGAAARPSQLLMGHQMVQALTRFLR